jgi:hypothetical protein
LLLIIKGFKLLKDVGDYFSSHIQLPTAMNEPMYTTTLHIHIGVDVVTSVNVKGVNRAIHPANTAVMIVMMNIGNVNNATICTGITILFRCLI